MTDFKQGERVEATIEGVFVRHDPRLGVLIETRDREQCWVPETSVLPTLKVYPMIGDGDMELRLGHHGEEQQ